MGHRAVLTCLAWLTTFALACSNAEQVAPTDMEPSADTVESTASTPQPARPTVQPLPLALDPIPARQGAEVNVSARGFSAGEEVSISASKTVWGSDLLSLGGATAASDGSIDSVPIALPDILESGPHAIEAVGQTSGRRSTGTLWIRARDPWLVLSAYELQPLTDIGFILGGFEPQEAVRVSMEGRTDQPVAGAVVQLTELSTDQAGNAEWAQVKLPLMKPGGYSIVLHGVAGGQELRRDLTIDSLKPSVELSPWAGPPGVPLQINARGFAPGERVHVSFGGAGMEVASVQADQDGNLWGAGPVRVPPTALTGRLTVVVSGETSGARVEPSFNVLETKPWLELTTWWGAPGVPVGFSGGGWIGGERVTFHVAIESAPVVADAQADDYGWLHTSGFARVPQDALSDVTFVALGEVSHATASATFKVVFPFDLRPHR